MSSEAAKSKTRQAPRAASRGKDVRAAVPAGSEFELRRFVQVVELEATALEDKLRQLRSLHEAEALLRLCVSLGIMGLAGFGVYKLLPPLALILVLPLMAGLLIVFMRLDHVARWLRRLFLVCGRKLGEPASDSKWQRYVVRPFLTGLNAIGSWTSGIENRYVRAGVGGAATLYYGGGAVAVGAAGLGAAAFVAYVAISITIAVAVIALFVAALIAVFGSK